MSTQYTNRKSIGWTPNQWSAIEDYATKTGMSASTAVRVLVMQALQQDIVKTDLPKEIGSFSAYRDQLAEHITTGARSPREIARDFRQQHPGIFNDPRMDDDYEPQDFTD